MHSTERARSDETLWICHLERRPARSQARCCQTWYGCNTCRPLLAALFGPDGLAKRGLFVGVKRTSIQRADVWNEPKRKSVAHQSCHFCIEPYFSCDHAVRGLATGLGWPREAKNEAINRVVGFANNWVLSWKYWNGECRGLLPIRWLSCQLRRTARGRSRTKP